MSRTKGHNGGGRSLVAGANAAFRARESERPAHDRILHDPFAAGFAERDPRIRVLRGARFLWPRLRREIEELQTAHCVRHRSVDTLLVDALDRGAAQVVIVGAGYDMRRSRFPAAEVSWFEVDHPATMGRKWRVLEGARDVNKDVRRIPLDLATSPLDEPLVAAGLDPGRPTVFVIEGFVHYLSSARFERLLAELARAAPSRTLVMSFIRTEMYAVADALFIRLVQALREVPRLHFSTGALAARLEASGLAEVEAWTGPEQVARFAPVASARPLRLSQDVLVART